VSNGLCAGTYTRLLAHKLAASEMCIREEQLVLLIPKERKVEGWSFKGAKQMELFISESEGVPVHVDVVGETMVVVCTARPRNSCCWFVRAQANCSSASHTDHRREHPESVEPEWKRTPRPGSCMPQVEGDVGFLPPGKPRDTVCYERGSVNF